MSIFEGTPPPNSSSCPPLPKSSSSSASESRLSFPNPGSRLPATPSPFPSEKAVPAVTPVQQTPQQQNDKEEDSATVNIPQQHAHPAPTTSEKNPQTGPKTKKSAPPPDESNLGGNQQKTESNKPPLAKRIWQARIVGTQNWKEIDEDPAARSLTEHKKMMRDRINKNLGPEAPYKVRFTVLDLNFPKERILLIEDTSHKTGPRKMAPLEKAEREGHLHLTVDWDNRMVELVMFDINTKESLQRIEKDLKIENSGSHIGENDKMAERSADTS
ncbi:hypothetical protein BDZ91DRAFT_801582 [Kalaharituber pfeilii]|nr:hypothetical protein BDZ91DRAFT_801582 [Kalaharituber pfeilii]